MSTELGKIERPEAEQFRPERKIYLVPLVFSPRKPPPDYAGLYEQYWSGVWEHLLKLETRIGSIAHIYHDAVGMAGDEGVRVAEQMSEKSAAVARAKLEAGATFEALEDPDLVAENMDWQRCLMAGLASQKVSELAWNSYNETLKRRYEVMSKRIDETLKPEEAGLLFVAEGHRIQFPTDVRVFYVSPPALDAIHRWLQDQQRRPEPESGPRTSDAGDST